MRVIVLVALAAILCSCATQAQRQFQAIKSGNEANVAALKACIETVYNSPEYSPIRGHLPLLVTDATLPQLGDKSLATQADAKALLVVHPRLQECRKAFLTGTLQTEPGIVPLVTAAYNKNDDDLLALTQRKLSWGEYVRRVRDRAVELQTDVLTEDRRVVAGLQQEHQAEIAQRQRAAEAMATWAQNQQMINAMNNARNRAVTTHCNAFGNSVNCVSQ